MWWEIRLAGRLPSYWQQWFHGFHLSLADTGDTVLTGQVPDQAALIGLLGAVARLNLTLLSARRLPDGAQNGG